VRHTTRAAAAFFACALAGGVVTGCGAPESSSGTPAAVADGAQGTPSEGEGDRERSAPGPQPRRVARMASNRGDAGNLVLEYAATQDETFGGYEQVFREHELFEGALAQLNELVVMPATVTVRLGECGEVNAFYVPPERTIAMCYELLSYFEEIFAAQLEPQSDEEWAEVGAKSIAAFFFVFYHELGHALVDVLDLPVTGREEDAVDQLATVMLLESWEGEDSELAILSSAEWFDIDASAAAELDMADEHSLDEQRYYNLVCWIYGSDTEYFATVASDWELPEARAERCEEEYVRMSGSWDQLLGPHLRADG
jgi:hypothetical protein